jgi:hypothetical protein
MLLPVSTRLEVRVFIGSRHCGSWRYAAEGHPFVSYVRGYLPNKTPLLVLAFQPRGSEFHAALPEQ